MNGDPIAISRLEARILVSRKGNIGMGNRTVLNPDMNQPKLFDSKVRLWLDFATWVGQMFLS